MLTLQNVSKTVKNSKKQSRELLENINITIRPGEFVAFSGSSNSGKSSLAEIVAVKGIDYQGEYYIDGIELSKYSSKQLKQMVESKFSYNSVLPKLCPIKTILANFLTALSHIKTSKKEKLEMIKNICQELDISEDVLALKPKDFSMGYSKYLSLAISLVVPAKVYVLDNPTALLDADCTALLIDYLTNLSKNPEMTIVVATTDEKLLLKAKRIINLENGRATEGAKPVRVLKQEKPKKQPARTTIRKEVFKLEPPKKVAKEPKKVEKVESTKEIEEKKPEKPAQIKNSIQDSMFDIVDDTTRNSSVSEKKTSGSLFDHINKKKAEEKTVSKTTKKVADKKETKPAKTTKKVEEESSEMLIKPVKSGSSRKR